MSRTTPTVALLTAVLLLACEGDSTPTPAARAVCPSFGETGSNFPELVLTPRALGTPAELSRPPELSAEANGDEVRLRQGPSSWCGIHADQFDVVTASEPLVTSPGDEVVVENPLPDDPHYATAIVQGPFPSPSPKDESLLWPNASWSAGFRRELDNEGQLSFKSPAEPGDYVVSIFLQYDETEDMFETSTREGQWSLYLKVVAD